MTAVARTLHGTFTLLAVHEDAPDVVVGARHDSPLVVGLGDGENFLGSDVAAFISHTREALELGQDQVVTITPGAVTVTGLRRAARAGAPVHGRLGRRRRREGRLPRPSWTRRSTTSRRPSRTRCSAAPTRAAAWCSTRSGSTSPCCVPSTRSSSSPAAPPPTPGTSPSTRSSTGAGSRSRSSSRTSSATATRWSTSARSSSRSRSPARRWTRSWRCGTRASRAPRCSRWSTPTARRSRASPTRCSTRTPAPRSPSRRPRRSSRRSPPPTCSACTWPSCAATSTPTRSREILTELRAMPDKIQQVLDRADRVREIARSMVDTQSVLFLGRHVGFPVAMEGALKLKELAYIHAEGFAAGELKHGPIALIEPGQPVFVIVPVAARPRLAALQGRLQHPGDPRPRRPHARDRRGRRRGRAAVRRRGLLRAAVARRCSRRCWPSCRCRSSRASWPRAKGLDVDQPRNLAKSVTVE